jgi:hypothetical protein
VNRSAALVVLVPPAVATVTSTAPALVAAVVTVIDVALFTVKLAAADVPNFTAVAPVKFEPVIVTDVPPFVVPVEGPTALSKGRLN